MTNKDDYLTDTENKENNLPEEDLSVSNRKTLTNINKNFTTKTDDINNPVNRAKTQEMPESLARAISQSIQDNENEDEDEEFTKKVKKEKNKKHHNKGCLFLIFILLLLLASITWCIRNQDKLPAPISNIIKANEKNIYVVKNFVKEKNSKNNLEEENDEEVENIQLLDSNELSLLDNSENKKEIFDNKDSKEVTEEEIASDSDEELNQENSNNQESSQIEDETLNKDDNETENMKINKDNTNNEEKEEPKSPLALELSQFADQLYDVENGKHIDIVFDNPPVPSEEETNDIPQNNTINNEAVNNIKNKQNEDLNTSESRIQKSTEEDKRTEEKNSEELINDKKEEEIPDIDTHKTSTISETVKNNEQKKIKPKKVKKLNYKLATKNILLAKNLPAVLKWTVVLDEDIDEMAKVVTDTANQYNFDPLFIAAIIMSESSFDSEIISESGKIGLLQIDPNKAPEIAKLLNIEWLGSEALKDPEYNLKLGVGFLNYCLQNHKNDFQGGMYAYNQGDDSKELDENAQALFNRYMDNIKFYLKSWGGHLPK